MFECLSSTFSAPLFVMLILFSFSIILILLKDCCRWVVSDNNSSIMHILCIYSPTLFYINIIKSPPYYFAILLKIASEIGEEREWKRKTLSKMQNLSWVQWVTKWRFLYLFMWFLSNSHIMLKYCYATVSASLQCITFIHIHKRNEMALTNVNIHIHCAEYIKRIIDN